jgi:4-amino-4-deoxy-L-arabinose transferase-like glycosyltransferase
MLYIERQPSTRSVLLLIALALLMYLGCLALFELRASDEALYAAFAQDMVSKGHALQTHLQGHPVRAFPLYSWLVALCSGFQSPSALSVRLPALLSLWGLALLAGLIARRIQGSFAGIVTAAVLVSSLVSFRIGCRAQSESIHALLLCAAWAAWYYYGQQGKKWYLAWGIALGLVFLAVLAVGAKAIFFFYFPLLFLHRPFNIFHRLQGPGHVSMLTLFLLLLGGWLYIVPGQPFLSWNTIMAGAGANSSSFMGHLFRFPLKCVIYLLPWAFFCWAPFCLALRQFERDSNACNLLRSIILCNGIALLLLPGVSPLLLLPAFGPMAILIGVHFEIVIRRYQHVLIGFLHAAGWTAFVLAAAGILFWCLTLIGLIRIDEFSRQRPFLFIAVLLGSMLLLWTQSLAPGCKRTFRSSLLWCVCAFRLVAMCVYFPLDNWLHESRRNTGLALAGLRPPLLAAAVSGDPDAVLPPEPTPAVNFQQLRRDIPQIYLHSKEFYQVETFYLHKPIVNISNPAQELPAAAETLLVLSARSPAVPTHNWEAISPAVDPQLRYRLQLRFRPDTENTLLPRWRQCLLSLHRLPERRDPAAPPTRLQLFRGTRR